MSEWVTRSPIELLWTAKNYYAALLDNTIAFIHNIDSNSISLSGRLQSISEIVSLLPIRHFHCAVITMYTIFRFSDIIQTLSDDVVIGQGCIKCCLLLFIGEGFFTEDSDVPWTTLKIFVHREMQVMVTSGSRNRINQTLEKEHKWHFQRASIEKQPWGFR